MRLGNNVGAEYQGLKDPHRVGGYSRYRFLIMLGRDNLGCQQKWARSINEVVYCTVLEPLARKQLVNNGLSKQFCM